MRITALHRSREGDPDIAEVEAEVSARWSDTFRLTFKETTKRGSYLPGRLVVAEVEMSGAELRALIAEATTEMDPEVPL